MRALIITDAVRAEIAAAIKRAEEHPVPRSVLEAFAVAVPREGHALKLSDRKPGFERPASEMVIIPRGYHVAFSIEDQPAGLCNHLSVSVDTPGMVPSPEALQMIAGEYGMPIDLEHPKANEVLWFEEFAVGHHAINLVTVREVRP